jgi:hypothetical protein
MILKPPEGGFKKSIFHRKHYSYYRLAVIPRTAESFEFYLFKSKFFVLKKAGVIKKRRTSF